MTLVITNRCRRSHETCRDGRGGESLTDDVRERQGATSPASCMHIDRVKEVSVCARLVEGGFLVVGVFVCKLLLPIRIVFFFGVVRRIVVALVRRHGQGRCRDGQHQSLFARLAQQDLVVAPRLGRRGGRLRGRPRTS